MNEPNGKQTPTLVTSTNTNIPVSKNEELNVVPISPSATNKLEGKKEKETQTQTQTHTFQNLSPLLSRTNSNGSFSPQNSGNYS
jgi:hypothetical protein